MTTLKQGDKAPDFCGINENGEKVCLSDFKGKKLILYFYPKDSSTGCTLEAQSLRDAYKDLTKRGYYVLGVSPNSEKSHTNFIEKQCLPFSLLADTDKSIATAYGVWAEKKMYGKTYMGIIRTTFIINDGIITDVITKVDTKNHSVQIP